MVDKVTSMWAFKETLASMVRADGPDLSARQICALMHVYQKEEAQTVRGLAAEFNISKPAVTRAIDRLSELDLVRRKIDPADRRSVLIQRTIKGAKFYDTLFKSLAKATSEAQQESSPG